MIMGSSNRHRRKGARHTRRRPRALGGAFCLLALGLTVAPTPAGAGGGGRSAEALAAAASAAGSVAEASVATSAVTLPQAQSNLSLAWAVPDYPVGHQLLWLLSVATQAPVPVAELKAHFDAQFLAAVAPATLNDDLVGLKLRAPLSVTSLEAPSPPSAGLGSGTSLLGAGLSWGNSALSLLIGVDGKGLISTLRVAPAPALPAAPTTWAGLDRQLRSLAPDVSFEAATLGTGATASPSGACHVLNALAPAAPRPLGSMFKLYVLATLASEVRSG
ncbi:MAG: Cpe/LpqF family protein, partial [Acidimicrobiales bacterium]